MGDALENPAFAILVGRESIARRSSATRAAATTANAKTELASACLVGTDGIVLWKDVREDVPGTGSAESHTTAIGSANASTDGTGQIVLL